MYENGQGVVQDNKEAYFWLLLTCANSDKKLFDDAKKMLNLLERELSSLQKEQIQARASKWFNEHK